MNKNRKNNKNKNLLIKIMKELNLLMKKKIIKMM